MTALLGPLAGLLVSGGVTHLTEKTYRSAAVIEIRPPVSLLVLEEPPREAFDRFFATQSAAIQSGEVLAGVVRELDLSRRWGLERRAAAERVRENLVVEPVAGTDLVKVEFTHFRREDARDVAKTVVKVYAGLRAERVARELKVLDALATDPDKAQEALVALLERQPADPVVVHTQPSVPEHAVSPDVTENLAIGAAAGLLLPLLTLLLLPVLDRSLPA